MAPRPLIATLARGEARLCFPYDERLRRLLRALPGRRWDPREREWCVPLDPEQARSLALLLAALSQHAQVSDELARAIARLRARRDLRECPLELARPDERWWLSAPSDAPAPALAALRTHPDAYELSPLGRLLLPLDVRAAALVHELAASALVRPSASARRALERLEAGDRAVGIRADTRDRPRGDRRRAGLAAVEQEPPSHPAVLALSGSHGPPTFVLVPGHDPAATHAFAALPGAMRSRAQPPAIRADPFCVPHLDAFLAEHRVWAQPDALECLQAIREQHARAAGLVGLSGATDAPLAVVGLGGELKPFQRAGVSYLLARKRAFLADEQGLGKTVQALATVEAAGAYPAIVVCPANLKLNWLRELGRWLPQRSVATLAGGRATGGAGVGATGGMGVGAAGGMGVGATGGMGVGATGGMGVGAAGGMGVRAAGGMGDGPVSASAGLAAEHAPSADITLLNYEIVAPRLGELCASEPRALVLDESHYCKNPRAKRTQAVAKLAAAVADDGLVLALSGTPVTNRTTELISQLRILGRLEEFAPLSSSGAAGVDSPPSPGPAGIRFAQRFRGPDAHLRLHWHLRSRCFVRRCKADVLPQLPAKTRTVVPVALDNEADYRLAERDLVAWLRAQPLDLRELDAKVAAAMRAERLVRCNALKLLAARGKLRAALAWIHDFLRSGERLVVFAAHREVQHAALERFPHALHILGQDSPAAREAALRAFQAPCDGERNQLIVCSLEVAGHGLTLTRASSVAFLELAWTPAAHDQAEDRCHRIGQHEAVNAYYLLAADTIDETISTLLERKRAVIGAVTDGREHDHESLLDTLVRELRATPYRHLRAVA